MYCKEIFDSICVLADGNVVCSCLDGHGNYVLGNVYEDDIDAVFHGDRYGGLRDWMGQAQGSYCKVLGYDCVQRRILDRPRKYAIKMLQIEVCYLCNLKCPDCVVADIALHKDRQKLLKFEIFKKIIDELPDLEIVKFYNYGESFLHPKDIDMLRYIKNKNKAIIIQVSTNGIPLHAKKQDAILNEGLLDRVIFCIDGCDQESYEKYRVRGNFDVAFNNMKRFSQNVREVGRDIYCEWQYILFRWNDTDEHLLRAKGLADEIPIRINFIETQTRSRSLRDYSKDVPVPIYQGTWVMMNANYKCEVSSNRKAIKTKPGQELRLSFFAKNVGRKAWVASEENDRIKFALRVRYEGEEEWNDIARAELSETINPGAEVDFECRFATPNKPGCYMIVADMIKENCFWFSDYNPVPLTLRMDVGPDTSQQASLAAGKYV